MTALGMSQTVEARVPGEHMRRALRQISLVEQGANVSKGMLTYSAGTVIVVDQCAFRSDLARRNLSLSHDVSCLRNPS